MQRSRAQFTRWTVAAVACALALVGVTRQASADANQTPIAVPLIGDSGAGSPYPSRITVTSRGGPAQTGQPFIMLHAVTHPCIEDLAVLLVHNGGTEKYLMLSHAGGCKALQGTDLIFTPAGTQIPDTDPSPGTPYAQTVVTTVSNYGSAPAFPLPAPAGPYLTTYPNTFFEGTWDLYVMDTAAGNRGVIAAGWSFNYPTTYTYSATGTFPVALPAGAPGTTLGPAARYPITFDLNSLPTGVKVWKATLSVTMSHTFPDDITVVLQGPNGVNVVVMANAGGTNDLTNTAITFNDSAPTSLPDNAPIPAGTYKPTTFGTVQNPPGGIPALAGTFATALSALNGQDAKGTWNLYVYDIAAGDSGSIGAASLTIQTEPNPILFNIDTPTTSTTYTANTPFLHFEGEIEDLANSQHTATWYNQVGGSYYAAGPMTFTPGSQVIKADIPMKKGTNFVTIYVRNTAGVALATDDVDVTVNEFVYTLSEGATGGFFDLDVTSANPTGLPAPLAIQFLPEHSAPIPYVSNVVANGQTQLHVDDLTPGDAVSTIVHSTDAVPLAVERTMSWDSTGYGGSGGTAIFPNKHWIFAEGSQGYFDTFLLLSNNGSIDANVNVKFLVEGGSPVNQAVVVPANKRVTVYAGDVAAIRNTSFGMDVTADQPITAERSMYFPHDGPRIWEGGHETGGVNDVSTHWFLAEGATGPFFECFVLLSNPSSSVAHVNLSYLLPDGSTIPQTVTVPANGRVTLNLEHDVPTSAAPDAHMANNAVSTTINSDVGIIVERSMYWPDISLGWREAHNSIGVTDSGLRWAVSDGRIGGPRNYQTYILLANPNSTQAEVQIRFLKSGAAPVVKTMTLAPTSRTNIAPATDPALAPLLGAGVFSADIQVLNFQPIVVEKALYWDSAGEVWAAGTGTVGTPIPPPEE